MAQIKIPDEFQEVVKNDKTTELKKPKTMNELKTNLKELGAQWRRDHTEIHEKGKVKIPHVNPRAVADILKRESTFILINEDNPELAPLSAYDIDEGIYKKGERFINKLCLAVERSLTAQQCKQIIFYLTNEVEERSKTDDENLVIVKNGIYNRETKKLQSFSPRYVFVNKVDTKYIPNAEEPIFGDWNFTNWITELSDNQEDKLRLLWECFYIAINTNYVSDVALLLDSGKKGKTGKGTFEQLLKNIIGKENTGALKISEFEKSFKLASIYGKPLVIGDDNNPNEYNLTSENFKSIVTGDLVLINPKNEKPFTTQLTPFIVQSMNGLPRFNDVTDGLKRRLRVLEFIHEYKGSNNNRKVKTHYIKNKQLHEYILAKVIDTKIDEVIETEESKKVVHSMELDSNPVLEFYENEVPNLSSTRVPVSFLFELYQAWSYKTNNKSSYKQRGFTKEIKPYMYESGWELKTNVMALESFHHSDFDRATTLDRNVNGFVQKVNDHKKESNWVRGE